MISAIEGGAPALASLSRNPAYIGERENLIFNDMS